MLSYCALSVLLSCLHIHLTSRSAPAGSGVYLGLIFCPESHFLAPVYWRICAIWFLNRVPCHAAGYVVVKIQLTSSAGYGILIDVGSYYTNLNSKCYKLTGISFNLTLSDYLWTQWMPWKSFLWDGLTTDRTPTWAPWFSYTAYRTWDWTFSYDAYFPSHYFP